MQTGPFKVYIEEIEDRPGFVKVVEIEGAESNAYYDMLIGHSIYAEIKDGELTIKEDGVRKYTLSKFSVVSKSKFILISEMIDDFNSIYSGTKEIVDVFDFEEYKKDGKKDTDAATNEQEETILNDFINNHSCPSILKAGRGILKVLIRYVYCIGYNEGYTNGKTKRSPTEAN